MFYENELKKNLISSIESLTIHGVPNIIKKENKLIKVWWLIITITSALVAVLFLRQTLLEYFRYNVITEVRLLESDKIEFPVITLCNLNKLSTVESIGFLKNQSKILKLSMKNIQSKIAFQLFQDINLEKRKNLTQSMKNMFQNGYFGEFQNNLINHSDFEWIFNKNYGNCYHFDSEKWLKEQKLDITEYGIENGLKIELNLSLPNEFNQHEKLFKAVFLSIDEKHVNLYDNFEDVIMLTAGYQTNIQIEKTLFKKYPFPYSNCNLDMADENMFEYYKTNSKYFKQIFDNNYTYYSESLCLEYCKIDHMFKKCHCILQESSIRFEDKIKICTGDKGKDCIKYFNSQQNYSLILKDVCHKKCPLECNKSRYTYTQTPLKIADVYGQDSNDTTILVIYFGSMNYLQYKETPSISFYSLMSNLGGTLGLFLGNYSLKISILKIIF